MKTMTAIAAALLSTGILFAGTEEQTKAKPSCSPKMKEQCGQKDVNRKAPFMMKKPCCQCCCMQQRPNQRGPWMQQRPNQRGPWMQQGNRMPMRKDGGFRRYLPGAADLFPEEFAKAEALKKTNPLEAAKQMGELRKKAMEQHMKESKALMEAIRAYRETKEEAKLTEVKNLVEKQIGSAVGNAKKKLEKSKKELAELKKLNLSADKAAFIGKIYEGEIANLEKFVSGDHKKMADKFVEMIKNGPERRGMKRPDGKTGKAPAPKAE